MNILTQIKRMMKMNRQIKHVLKKQDNTQVGYFFHNEDELNKIVSHDGRTYVFLYMASDGNRYYMETDVYAVDTLLVTKGMLDDNAITTNKIAAGSVTSVATEGDGSV